ncbi:Histone chaperone [Penicillium malachiteum]|uniref:Histone chaperone n=1 Tax=Penicillium malachiteum TaxID=1324776 RepID=UPI002547F9CA|nr:Histone chaperone [Penicillium malachiteum]KAJ5736759.1 Histone chaperone [Penicillium malachiteum]
MAFAAINSAGSSVITPITVIEEAFATEPSLKKRVYDAIGATPQNTSLFEDLARYTSALLARSTTTSSLPFVPPPEGPAAKKRKIENGQESIDLKDPNLPVQFYVKDVSFSMPQRKKLTLEITAGAEYLRARNQTTKQIEFGVPMNRIRHALSLPVPEKAQKQFNFCIIPEYADGTTPPPAGVMVWDCMVFTVPDGPAKTAFSGSGEQLGHNKGETLEALIRKILNQNLPHLPHLPAMPKKVKKNEKSGKSEEGEESDESEEIEENEKSEKVDRPQTSKFVSFFTEAQHKGEKSYHVKGNRGSKDGYLFFLSTGVLFAFKKPLLFFPTDRIASFAIPQVVSRSFTLILRTKPRNGTEEGQTEFEFTMIHVEEDPKIRKYFERWVREVKFDQKDVEKEHRAKEQIANGTKKGKKRNASSNAKADAKEEESELQKAFRDYENQEDDDESDEEDYDPGNEGESEGSGPSSDEEDDDDDEEEEDDDDQDDQED